jgi:hypothetical protein
MELPPIARLFAAIHTRLDDELRAHERCVEERERTTARGFQDDDNPF